MKSNRVRFLALAMLTACPCFPASILLSGNSMPNTLTLAGNLGKLDGNSYTFVDTSLFAGISLSGYDLVWLDGFSQYVDLSSLTPYLNAGGRVLVQNPGFGSEPLSAYPGGAALSAIFESKDSVRIVAPDDFLNLGLTNDGLSGWGPSAYGFFSTVSQGFLVLTDDGTSGESITIRQSSGPGTLVYTQQGLSQFLSNNDVALGSPQLQFLENLTGAPEPGAAALLMILLGLLVLQRKR